MQTHLKNGAAKKGNQPLDFFTAQKEKAKNVGKTLGLTNMPSPQEPTIEPFISPFRAAFTAQLPLRGPSNESDVSEIENRSSEERASRLTEKLTEVKGKLKHELLEIDELDDDDARHQNTFFVKVGIGMVALVECLFTYKSFSILDVGNNLVMAILMVALTIAFIALPKMLKWWYEEYIVDSPNRGLLSVVPVIVLGMGFLVIGILRSKYLAAQSALSISDTGGAQAITVSPFFFVGISAMLLLISYYLAFQLPSTTQKKNRAALDKKESKIAKLEQEIERLETELSAIPDRQKNSLIRASHSNTSRRDGYIHINSQFKEAVGAFIEANLIYRTDGLRPKCFDLTVADLEDHTA
jgi:hypothetical protein